ncbi:MAG: 4-hydroxy-3-methylbut-2-enyl diphosphate reductase [candidate division NC10 bacterium]|nr:4-hydroxy-3-methylbut-2-enyl diphosphate reductase [candidate division NC10 bacterium]
MSIERVILAAPRGFCAGVDRAIDIVSLALEIYGSPVYVRKEIVHNAHVVQELGGRGAVFVDDLDEIPDGARVIFSAHGISPEVRAQAAAKRHRVIDATCPLVTKVHHEALKYSRNGRWVILVGHAGHDEVVGTMGHVPGRMLLVGSVEEAEQVQIPDPDRVAVITQTTLSIDDTREIMAVLKRRFPSAVLPPKDDICYATQNRQMAVKEMTGLVDLLLVIGSTNSSNSMRLVEVAQAAGVRAYLIDDISEMDPGWLEGVRTVGITAGASAPEHLVEEAVEFFRRMGVSRVEALDGIREDVVFALPPEIQRDLPPESKAGRSLRVLG